MAEKKEKNIDIWLIMVIVLLILSIGGGLYVTGQAVLSRIDALAVQTQGVGRLESEVFALRKEIQTLQVKVNKLKVAPATAAASVPAPPEPKKTP